MSETRTCSPSACAVRCATRRPPAAPRSRSASAWRSTRGTAALPKRSSWPLTRPAPLDEGDWQEIRRHPLVAARILDSNAVADIRNWILSHHERPDGRGYPHGLAGDAIPLEARILAVADAYEAMTSERIYRTALSPAEARAELQRGIGSQFDERVVQAFTRVLDRLGVPR